MSEQFAFPAFLQAIGVVAVYSIIKDVVPKLFGKNGKNGKLEKDETLTVEQHDKECKMKLTPMEKKIDEVHKDLKDYMRHQGVNPASDSG